MADGEKPTTSSSKPNPQKTIAVFCPRVEVHASSELSQCLIAGNDHAIAPITPNPKIMAKPNLCRSLVDGFLFTSNNKLSPNYFLHDAMVKPHVLAIAGLMANVSGASRYPPHQPTGSRSDADRTKSAHASEAYSANSSAASSLRTRIIGSPSGWLTDSSSVADDQR